MQLSQGDVVEILRIVDACGIGELRLEVGELRLHVVKGGAQVSGIAQAPYSTPAAQATPADRQPQASQASAASSGLFEVTAPMIGTFYCAPSPGAMPFVQPGQVVQPDTPVGIVEVMKLMNTINAGVAGTVREVRAGDAQMVEYGQVLVLIEPAEKAHA